MSSTVFDISRSDLSNLKPAAKSSITDVKHLSSYNWIATPTPTIAVPGSPPLWSDAKAPIQLRKDSGLIYIAQNAARHPDSPLEPLFRALYIADPLFEICSIDVVSDRNIIRKLLSFVDPGSTRNGLEAFTIKIEAMKGTAVLCRAETAVQVFVGKNDFRGYGHEFEKTYTINQIHDSTGHCRIISYRLNSLNFIIRHEADGYIGVDTTTKSDGHEVEENSLSEMLGSLWLSSLNVPSETTPIGSKLTIRKEGQTGALESTHEIKTRVHHKPLSIEEVAPQLWTSQTPKFVRAHYKRGKFNAPVVEDVAAEIKRWDDNNQGTLTVLAALIAKIIDMAKAHGHAVIKYDREGDRLVIRKAEEKKMLPEDLYRIWEAIRSAGNGGDLAAGSTRTE